MGINEINECIDYHKLFNRLVDECREDMIDHCMEASHYKDILGFFELSSHFKVDLFESSLDNKQVTFLFIRSLNNANESNPRSDEESYFINFDFVLNEFTFCEYEVG
jgi:hypothetical protein